MVDLDFVLRKCLAKCDIYALILQFQTSLVLLSHNDIGLTLVQMYGKKTFVSFIPLVKTIDAKMGVFPRKRESESNSVAKFQEMGSKTSGPIY